MPLCSSSGLFQYSGGRRGASVTSLSLAPLQWSLMGSSVVTAGAVQAGCGLGDFGEPLRRAQERIGRDIGVLAVAPQAPAHGELADLLDARHGLDVAMALLTRDAGQHV